MVLFSIRDLGTTRGRESDGQNGETDGQSDGCTHYADSRIDEHGDARLAGKGEFALSKNYNDETYVFG